MLAPWSSVGTVGTMAPMSSDRIAGFQLRTPRSVEDRTVLADLADAPVDLSRTFEVPESFLSEGRPDEIVAAELADPEVQQIFRSAGLA